MNINQLLKQAQSMQKKMKEMQEELAQQEFEGKAGGGLINVIMSGDGQMKKVSIDPSMLKPEDKEMLEDLLMAAYNEAKSKAENASKQNMTGAFGNLGGMFPGSGLPF